MQPEMEGNRRLDGTPSGRLMDGQPMGGWMVDSGRPKQMERAETIESVNMQPYAEQGNRLRAASLLTHL